MPRMPWTLFALTAVGLAAVPSALADTRQQIQKAYDQRDAAINRFDIEGYLASYNGNYRNVTGAGPSGTTDRQRQTVIREFQQSQRISRHETVESVTPYGDGVTTTAVTTRIVTEPKTRRAVRRVDTDHDRAFWVRTRMGWRIKQERTLSRE